MAAQQLLSSFGSVGVSKGLDTVTVDIDDTSTYSTYFNVVQFSPVLTAGRNSVSFNGSNLLLSGSEIQVACFDSNGNSLYLEVPNSKTQYSTAAKFIVSISVFNEIYNGPGKLVLVGTTAKNESVRWIGNITIDKTSQNSSTVIFYNTPTIEARPLLYPVVNTAVGSSLTFQQVFTGSFTSYAVHPLKDTNQKAINPKTTDIDYRLVLNGLPYVTTPTLYPTSSFNSQMNGQNIFITATTVQPPYSYTDKATHTTASFTIKNVVDSKTIQLSDAFYFPYNQNKIVTNVNLGTFTASYKWIAYNTASDSYQQYVPLTGSPIFIEQSYAEIIYRNIETFSGFVARHKLYRKSLIFPGDFQLLIDSPLAATEMLVDPITSNKTYLQLGTFYNQSHINKYWKTSNGAVSLALSASVSPMIDAVRVAAPPGQWPDGNTYAIVKASNSGVVNDAIYYPFDSASYANLTGSSYNSNFVNLIGGSLYVLSMNVIMEKPIKATDSKISFYFTSSIPAITLEKNYVNPYGLLIGEITSSDLTATKVFTDKQMLFFTPSNDYYGTIVAVPHDCNVTLANFSLQVYGDYGFSPDSLSTKIPFPINVANEGWIIKSELFDINSTLVYSGLQTIQSFDPGGASLFVYITNSNLDPTKNQFISSSLSISQSLFLPNIPTCPTTNIRLMGWSVPTHTPPKTSEGQVCYTDISQLAITATGAGTSILGDYITVGETVFTGSGQVLSTATALSIKYSSAGNLGRKIIINSSGSKTVYP